VAGGRGGRDRRGARLQQPRRHVRAAARRPRRLRQVLRLPARRQRLLRAPRGARARQLALRRAAAAGAGGARAQRRVRDGCSSARPKRPEPREDPRTHAALCPHCPATPRDGSTPCSTLAPSVCPAVAVLAGHLDIPQISYWSTSSALDDTTTYPRFMRTIPTGLPLLWSSIPQLAQTNLLCLGLICAILTRFAPHTAHAARLALADEALAHALCEFLAREMSFGYVSIVYDSFESWAAAYQENLVEVHAHACSFGAGTWNPRTLDLCRTPREWFPHYLQTDLRVSPSRRHSRLHTYLPARWTHRAATRTT